MKAKLFITDANHQSQHATWCAEGLRHHGWEVEKAAHDADVDCDLAVVWGWRRLTLISTAHVRKVPILVMERGHLHPRFEWTSMGFNGLGNMAKYSPTHDDGKRFHEHWGHLMQPWTEREGYVLVMGQVAGDASLHGLDIRAWEKKAVEAYRSLGHEVVFRPHPLSRVPLDIDATIDTDTPIEVSLKGASLCVTYTSTSGVEAALAGVPVVTCHQGSMARPVSSHGLYSDPMRPPREEWAKRLAWTQFRPHEIRDGFAWECLKAAMPAR